MLSTSRRLMVSLLLMTLAPGWCRGEEMFRSLANGKQFIVIVHDEEVAKTPKWKADAENPPISARKALSLANAAKERLIKDDDAYKWHLQSIQLTATNKRQEGWYWVVCYEGAYHGLGSSGPRKLFKLAVLMDGTVPEPTVAKQ
jgi:hypothetical protein